jgi:8-oxo-dGTP pyrophosphatase MutT (NUDIX family)
MLNAPGSASSKRLKSSGTVDGVSSRIRVMTREISAGGVVLRQIAGVWHVALIEPPKNDLQINEAQKSEPRAETAKPAKTPRKRSKAVLTLPKGLVDPGEKPQAAAVREVYEETGIVAEPVNKLADNKYVYVRQWGDGARVFKIVTFYLMRYVSGEINDLASDMRIEVLRALWVPLAEAPSQLAYSNERKVLRQAQDYLEKQTFVG